MKKEPIILISLILLLFILNYSFLDEKLETFLVNQDSVFIERVIDGDTVVIENKTSIRLLGINSPERGEDYYSEAKEFLEGEILNKTVQLKYGKDKYDRYKRVLAYVYINRQNINLRLIEQGFANFYFPSGKDVNYNEFKEAWEKCIESNKNLCEKSTNKCADCIELKEFDHKNEEVVFFNQCSFNCDVTNWEIKDEGRKNFIFPEFILESERKVKIKVDKSGEDNKEELFWIRDDYVWTNTGDTLFLRDVEGKLVLWRSY